MNRNDDFFDRADRRLEKAFENPGKSLVKVGVVVILLNLLFWGAIIAMVVFGLSLVL